MCNNINIPPVPTHARGTRTCAKTNLLTIGAFKFHSQPPVRCCAGREERRDEKKTLCLVFYAKSSFPDARIIVDPVMRVFILSFATLCMNKALSTPLSTLFRLFFEKRSLRFSFDFLSRAQQRFARRLHRRARLKQV